MHNSKLTPEIGLQKELNRPELRSCYIKEGQVHSPAHILLNGILRPLKMLFLSPIVFLLALYMSVAYGLLYLLFTTITTVFIDVYHWAPDICGRFSISRPRSLILGFLERFPCPISHIITNVSPQVLHTSVLASVLSAVSWSSPKFLTQP